MRSRCVVWALWLLCAGSTGLHGCSNAEPPTAVERGRRVYLANCIVCHNPDPAKPGAAGPEIAGSSRALIEARVLHAAYPPGYTPKRTTKAMVALPYLAAQIDDLAAYLASPTSRPQ